MKTSQPTTAQGIPTHGETACGARVMITPDTPSIHYCDEIVYFCGWDCRQLYDEDPLNSCMASRLISSR